MSEITYDGRQRSWEERGSTGEQIKRLDEVVIQSAKDLMTDSGPQWAAAIAYYALLSAFPLLLAIGAIAAYFVDPQWVVERATRILGEFVPTGEGRVEEIVNRAMQARDTVGILSLLGLLWTGTRVFSALTKALNIVYDADETYGFFKRLLVELAMLLTVGVILILALAAPAIMGLLPFLSAQNLGTEIVQAVVQGLLLLVAFFLMYRFVPRGRQSGQAAMTGAAIATLIFLVAQPLFLYYVNNFANYNLIYGSLAIVIILMIWTWMVSLITLFGGEVASHTEDMVLEGRSAEEVGRQHADRNPTARKTS